MRSFFTQAELATRELLPTDHPSFSRVRSLFEALLEIKEYVETSIPRSQDTLIDFGHIASLAEGGLDP